MSHEMRIRRVLKLVFFVHFVAASLLLLRFAHIRRPILGTSYDLHVPVRLNFTKYLLVTYIRSGSTFLGDLVQANRDTFYTFEPLNYLDIKVNRMTDDRIVEAVDILARMFNCDVSMVGKMVKKYPNMSRFNIAGFYRELKARNSLNCKRPEVIAAACSQCNIRVLKVVRLRVRQLKVMFAEYGNIFQEVKVLVNRRDPRGMFNSRQSRPWCRPPTSCYDIRTMCEEMREDLAVYKVLKKQYPDNFASVRFEDLALEPHERSQLLYEQLGLDWTIDTEQYVKLHTSVQGNGSKLTRHPYSTYRDSRSVPFAWMYKLEWETVDKIQTECKDVMHAFGYILVNETFFNSEADFDLADVLDLNYYD